MCDKAAFNRLEHKVSKLEENYAVHSACSEERFKTIFGIIKWIISFILLMTLILLLTVVYGAVGERGFHAVTEHASSVSLK